MCHIVIFFWMYAYIPIVETRGFTLIFGNTRRVYTYNYKLLIPINIGLANIGYNLFYYAFKG